MEEILFGGLTTSPSAAVEAPPFKKKEGNSTAFDLIEQAFVQLAGREEEQGKYGDPEKGATLEQTWRTSALFTGKYPVCLLATGRPDVPVAAIEKLVKVNPQQLTEVCKKILLLSERSSLQTLYYDGRTGHCIVLNKYDETSSRFTYYDPWPEFSLLSKKYNAAGVDAKQVDKQIWTMTDEELCRVVFAVFVPKNFWAAFSGQSFSLLLTALQQGDFWSFFHINVTDTQTETDGTLYRMKTGGFQSEIDITVKINRSGEVSRSVLYINQSWLFGPPYGINPFALDVVRSFIAAMISPSDAAFSRETDQLFQPETIEEYAHLFLDNKDDSTRNSSIAKVYFGITERYPVPLEFSDVLFANEVFGQTVRLVVTASIDNIN